MSAAEKALLVGVAFTRRPPRSRTAPLDAAAAADAHPNSAPGSGAPDPLLESLAELRTLALSAGAIPVGAVLQRRPAPDAATYLGSGKIDELRAALASSAADLLLLDADISPTQQRNLEAALDIRVLSRTQLILDIFARHARTREGQLQVELAQLEYLLPRLSGHGAAMSRLGGGIGTRGPGETKLETDRRRIHVRIKNLRQDLARVREQRGQQRRQREGVPLATIALVGYTNAGKSALFNHLTGATVLTSARMFATLDPTLRSLRLPSRRGVLLSDTVGFLRDLPHSLISAFRATLEEVTRAALLTLVADAASPLRRQHLAEVQKVLRELEVESTPQLLVWNKADLLSPGERSRLLAESAHPAAPVQVLVSAKTGEGIPQLLAEFDRHLSADAPDELHLRIPQPAGRWLHLLYEGAEVLSTTPAAAFVDVVARVPPSLARRLLPFRTPD